jgi:hypothetical protein
VKGGREEGRKVDEVNEGREKVKGIKEGRERKEGSEWKE